MIFLMGNQGFQVIAVVIVGLVLILIGFYLGVFRQLKNVSTGLNIQTSQNENSLNYYEDLKTSLKREFK